MADAIVPIGPFPPLYFINSGTSLVPVTSSDPLPVDINGGSVVIGGLATVQGADAAGSAITGKPVLIGARAATTEPTAVADGQAVDILSDKFGRLVTVPYAVPEARLRGFITSTVTAAATIIASPGTTESVLLTGLFLGNTGTVQTVATLNDSVSSQFLLPAGGASNLKFDPPLLINAGTAVTMALSIAPAGGSVTALGVGYKSP